MRLLLLVSVLVFSISCDAGSNAQPQSSLEVANDLYSNGDFGWAIPHFTAEIEAHGHVVPVALYRRRGTCFLFVGDYDRAIRDFSRVLDEDPECEVSLLSRGRSYSSIGLAEEAESDFSKVILRNPRDVEALMSRAKNRQLLGRHRAAINDCEAVLRVEQLDRVYLVRAESFLALHMFDAAISDYTYAIELSGDYRAQALVSRSWAYAALGDIAKAEADLAESEAF